MADVSQTEAPPPHTNGISGDDGLLQDESDKAKIRPADIDADMREMERRKRVESIMNSRLFREELERIIETQMRDGGIGYGPSSGLLQQISDLMGVVPTGGRMFKNANCVLPINDIRGVESMGYAKGEKILRCKLASVFRLMDLYGWTQGIGNQISARLSQDQEHFLVNPYGILYHEITASTLIKINMQGGVVESGTTNFNVNFASFSLHSAIYAARPDLKCIVHIQAPCVLAVSSLKCGLLALSHESVVIGDVSTTQAYLAGAVLEPEQREKIARNLGPINKVLFLTNHGAVCCGETIEEAFFNVYNTVLACETQLKLMPIGLDNLSLVTEEARKQIYETARKPPQAAAVVGDNSVDKKWRIGGVEFEALMRMLDNAGFRTGYIYRHPLIKGEPPRPKNDVEVPPAVSSLGYLLEEEELYKQGLWKRLDGKKGHDRTRWLNSPNVYQKVEILETGTPDPKKITKWVADDSPTHSTSTPVKIDSALQFVPKNTNPKEFKQLQQQIKDYRRADKISAGPQSHILEGVSWEEAKKMQDASVTQTGDQVVLVGAASKGIIQRGYQHNAMVYKTPYAKNPFDAVTDEELDEYKKVVERKARGEYDTDFSESEQLSSFNQRNAANQIRSPMSGASETEEESRDEPRVLRIETKTAPRPSQPEVVLSDESSDPSTTFIRQEQNQNVAHHLPPRPPSKREQDNKAATISTEEALTALKLSWITDPCRMKGGRGKGGRGRAYEDGLLGYRSMPLTAVTELLSMNNPVHLYKAHYTFKAIRMRPQLIEITTTHTSNQLKSASCNQIKTKHAYTQIDPITFCHVATQFNSTQTFHFANESLSHDGTVTQTTVVNLFDLPPSSPSKFNIESDDNEPDSLHSDIENGHYCSFDFDDNIQLLNSAEKFTEQVTNLNIDYEIFKNLVMEAKQILLQPNLDERATTPSSSSTSPCQLATIHEENIPTKVHQFTENDLNYENVSNVSNIFHSQPVARNLTYRTIDESTFEKVFNTNFITSTDLEDGNSSTEANDNDTSIWLQLNWTDNNENVDFNKNIVENELDSKNKFENTIENNHNFDQDEDNLQLNCQNNIFDKKMLIDSMKNDIWLFLEQKLCLIEECGVQSNDQDVIETLNDDFIFEPNWLDEEEIHFHDHKLLISINDEYFYENEYLKPNNKSIQFELMPDTVNNHRNIVSTRNFYKLVFDNCCSDHNSWLCQDLVVSSTSKSAPNLVHLLSELLNTLMPPPSPSIAIHNQIVSQNRKVKNIFEMLLELFYNHFNIDSNARHFSLSQIVIDTNYLNTVDKISFQLYGIDDQAIFNQESDEFLTNEIKNHIWLLVEEKLCDNENKNKLNLIETNIYNFIYHLIINDQHLDDNINIYMTNQYQNLIESLRKLYKEYFGNNKLLQHQVNSQITRNLLQKFQNLLFTMQCDSVYQQILQFLNKTFEIIECGEDKTVVPSTPPKSLPYEPISKQDIIDTDPTISSFSLNSTKSGNVKFWYNLNQSPTVKCAAERKIPSVQIGIDHNLYNQTVNVDLNQFILNILNICINQSIVNATTTTTSPPQSLHNQSITSFYSLTSSCDSFQSAQYCVDY